jgi:hypothetical protein
MLSDNYLTYFYYPFISIESQAKIDFFDYDIRPENNNYLPLFLPGSNSV